MSDNSIRIAKLLSARALSELHELEDLALQEGRGVQGFSAVVESLVILSKVLEEAFPGIDTDPEAWTPGSVDRYSHGDFEHYDFGSGSKHVDYAHIDTDQ